MTNYPRQSDRLRRFGGTIALLGIAAIVAAAVIVPERAWAGGYVAAFYLLTLGLGGAVFVALANVTDASWHVAIRRVPEALTWLIPVGGALLIGLLFSQTDRFAWHFHGRGDVGSFWFKQWWLTPGFLLLRSVGYLGLWIAFTYRLVAASHAQDQLPATSANRLGAVASALFLAVFAVTFSLAAIDWIMALEPLWFSTIWGVYHFSGMFQATLAAVIIAAVLLRRGGRLQSFFRDEHLHDLGKLLLGFSCFWIYIWFCQYMLIWYSNIPEETVYFSRRIQGAWGPMIVASLVLNWGVPFFVLLPRQSKRSERIMLRVAGAVLLGRWIDLSVLIYPPVVGDAPPLGVPEVAGMVAGAGIAIWLFDVAFSRAHPVPLRDPYLEESLHYTN
ncbi:MAG: hypothetical protein U0939_09540 [Pirellulales bacterium]